MIKKIGNTQRYNIYIGMNDKDTLQKLCPPEEFIKIVNDICVNYKIGFSMTKLFGGYMMKSGEFITEESLVISIGGANEEEIFKLAEELRLKFNQETVLVSLETPAVFISEN